MRTKQIISIFLVSSVIIGLLLLSVNLFKNQEIDGENSEDQLTLFMFHVFLAGHDEYMTETLYQLKADLHENMEWTAPPYFWDELEPIDNQFNWTELDNFINKSTKPFIVIF